MGSIPPADAPMTMMSLPGAEILLAASRQTPGGGPARTIPTRRKAQSPKPQAQSSKLKAQSAKRKAQSFKLKAQSAKRKAQSSKLQAQSPKLKAQSFKLKAQSQREEEKANENESLEGNGERMGCAWSLDHFCLRLLASKFWLSVQGLWA